MPEPVEHFEEPAETEESEFEIEARLQPVELGTMPVRSLPISSEDLQHTDDKNLDREFEESLRRNDDELMPIPGGEAVLTSFFGEMKKAESEEGPKAASTESRENNKALEIAARLSEEETDDDQIPVLPDSPNEQDLLDFASRHPAVKNITRLFRGKVTAVRKKE